MSIFANLCSFFDNFLSWCVLFSSSTLPFPVNVCLCHATWAESSSSHLWAESHLQVIFNQGSLQNPGHAPTPRQFVIQQPMVFYIGSRSTYCLLPLILLWFWLFFYPHLLSPSLQFTSRGKHSLKPRLLFSACPLQTKICALYKYCYPNKANNSNLASRATASLYRVN